MATPKQVKTFLEKYKVYLNKDFVFIQRDKNLADLASLGFTIPNAKVTLHNLEPEDYVQGPLEDKKYQGHHLWVFGSEIDGEEIYIKISDNFVGDCAKCISFHKAEFPLKYPLKKE